MAVKKRFPSFDHLLAEAQTPVLVDFYAVWCGPCQMMAPILDRVKQALPDQLTIVKIDTDKYPQLASRYHIEALPTLVLFQGGQPTERFEGVVPAEQLIARLQQRL